MPDTTPTEEDVARFWDQHAELWHREVRGGSDITREAFNQPAFLAFVGELSGMSVLDAGCGDGFTTRHFAMRGARVVGLDLAPEMVRRAKLDEQASPLGIRYEVGSYTDLKRFEPGSFDRVVSFMALMDGPGLEGAFTEFFSALRPGGELFFAVTHPCFISPGMKWRRVRTEYRLQVEGYFDRGAGFQPVAFPSAPDARFMVPRFQRTLSDYFNALSRCGLALVAIDEPRPDEKLCEKNPSLRGYRRHAAMFLYVRARKPG